MKKMIALTAAVALVTAAAFVVAGGNDAVACDKAATASASKDCSKADAATASSGCSKSAAVAASSGCSKSAAVAASSGCTKSAAATASAGCCASKDAVAGYTKASCTDARTTALKEITDELPYMESKRIVLSGSMACGKCSFEATETCAPLFKTVDGKVYPLASSNMVKSMRGAKADGFEVAARVVKHDGVKYLDVQSFKTL